VAVSGKHDQELPFDGGNLVRMRVTARPDSRINRRRPFLKIIKQPTPWTTSPPAARRLWGWTSVCGRPPILWRPPY